MHSNPNLVPTVITDVTGKVTTVHKKQAGVASGAQRIPAPAMAQRAVQKPVKTATPLALPPALSNDERDELLARLQAVPNFWGGDTSGMKDWVDETGFALIKEYLDTDRITPMEIKHITGIARVQGWSKTEVTNMLLVTERLRHDSSIDNQARGWLNSVVHSLRYNTEWKHNPPIRTEEDLASAVAVTTFVLRKFHDKDNHLGLVKTVRQSRAWRTPEELVVISNKHLDALIRERPQDLDRIINYVETNRMHSANKKPVNVLRDFLDDDIVPALDDGWL
jgi:hypothetical protein